MPQAGLTIGMALQLGHVLLRAIVDGLDFPFLQRHVILLGIGSIETDNFE